MSSNRNRRLTKEIADIRKDSSSGITITNMQGTDDFSDLTHFKGHFVGPPDTPYEGGKYEVDIKITSEYPFKPPDMRFITKIWHPNVSSQTGVICLDTLSTAWSPVLTLKSALISLQSLLSSPEPKDPQDAEVATMLLTRPKEFARVAQDWAQRYAGAVRPTASLNKSGGSSPSITSDADGERQAEESRKHQAQNQAAYKGYNHAMVDRFVAMGFGVEQVVAAFEYVGIDDLGGEEYEMEEEYMGDVTARLFGEM